MMLEVLRTGRPASWGGQRDEAEWARAMSGRLRRDVHVPAWRAGGRISRRPWRASFGFSQYRSLIDIAERRASTRLHPGPASGLEDGAPGEEPGGQGGQAGPGAEGLAGKVEVISADMFREIPRGFDIIFSPTSGTTGGWRKTGGWRGSRTTRSILAGSS